MIQAQHVLCRYWRTNRMKKKEIARSWNGCEINLHNSTCVYFYHRFSMPFSCCSYSYLGVALLSLLSLCVSSVLISFFAFKQLSVVWPELLNFFSMHFLLIKFPLISDTLLNIAKLPFQYEQIINDVKWIVRSDISQITISLELQSDNSFDDFCELLTCFIILVLHCEWRHKPHAVYDSNIRLRSSEQMQHF